MSDEKSQHDLCEAQSAGSSVHLDDEPAALNCYANPNFRESSDDQELHDTNQENKDDQVFDPTEFRNFLAKRRKNSIDLENTRDDVLFRMKNFLPKKRKTQIDRSVSNYSMRAMTKPSLETVVRWTNLEVEVSAKGKIKKILDGACGEINNLDIMAILGPSGAGKTTLLNTIAGRVKNFRGKVHFYSKDKNISFAYVPQTDSLAEYFTVKECLYFASRIKNPKDTDHKKEVEFILDALNLRNVRNNYTYKCSGGERKRLSIGLEMISKPKILILDEPTSGLDSTTSYSVIQQIRQANIKTTVVATIHQPNSHLFQLFDKCYVLTDGKCIYNGKPATLIDDLMTRYNLVCPEFTSPAEFILEIANDVKTESGQEVIHTLATYEQKASLKQISSIESNENEDENKSLLFHDPSDGTQVRLKKIERSSFERKHHFFKEYLLNLKKLLKCNMRDPQSSLFRALNNMNFPIMLWMIRTLRFGKENGCTFLPLNGTHIYEENAFELYDRQNDGRLDVCSVFINLMFSFFSALVPATLCLSSHIRMFRKEYLNSYYTINSFILAVFSVNVLFSLVYTTANVTSFFIFTDFECDTEKYIWFWITNFLSNNCGDLIGLLLSIFFSKGDQKTSALIMGSFFGFSLWMWSGFFVQIDTMQPYIQKMTNFLFCRHLLESTIRILYSGRCKIADHMIFSYGHVKQFIQLYNTQTDDARLEPIGDMSGKVRNVLLEYPWNKTTMIEFITQTNGLNQTETDKLHHFLEYRTNYLLNSFDLNETGRVLNVVVPAITVVVLLFLCFILIHWRVKK